MLNLLWKNKPKNNPTSTPESIDQSSILRVVGDRGSGKTSYMAALAYWPNANPSSPVKTVTPVGDEANELVAKAQNILEQGLGMEPTDLEARPEEVKDYTLAIALKGQFSWKKANITTKSQLVKLNISSKDYAGEFFSDLVHKKGDQKLQDYLEDCIQANGIMLLVDGTSHAKDGEYANNLGQFLRELDRSDVAMNQRRIALVITKCENPELWVNRHNPKLVATARFRQTYAKLESWGGQIDCFMTSAFGMLGNRYPEPNSVKIKRDRGGTTSAIKDPKHWRPFGLVSPIYWLCTGERHPELDKD